VTQGTTPASPRPVTATGPPESGDPRRRPLLEDPIARFFVFIRVYLQTEGILVKPEKDIGASRLNRNSNSDVFSLIVVNCVENRRKFRKL
jgi:hypothetical protein